VGLALRDRKQRANVSRIESEGSSLLKELTIEWFGTYAIFKDIDGNEFWI
jgi:hypothetical protein